MLAPSRLGAAVGRESFDGGALRRHLFSVHHSYHWIYRWSLWLGPFGPSVGRSPTHGNHRFCMTCLAPYGFLALGARFARPKRPPIQIFDFTGGMARKATATEGHLRLNIWFSMADWQLSFGSHAALCASQRCAPKGHFRKESWCLALRGTI